LRAQEDNILMQGHHMHGNKWTEIAKMVQGRCDTSRRPSMPARRPFPACAHLPKRREITYHMRSPPTDFRNASRQIPPNTHKAPRHDDLGWGYPDPEGAHSSATVVRVLRVQMLSSPAAVRTTYTHTEGITSLLGMTESTKGGPLRIARNENYA